MRTGRIAEYRLTRHDPVHEIPAQDSASPGSGAGRDLIRQISQSRDVVIVRGAVSPDHIHLLRAAPPILAPAKLAQYIKGRSSRHVQSEFPGTAETVLGDKTCERGPTFARRWTGQRSKPILKTTNGTKMTGASRSQCPGSLETALRRSSLQAVQSLYAFSRLRFYRL
jgi:hypothetical protein